MSKTEIQQLVVLLLLLLFVGVLLFSQKNPQPGGGVLPVGPAIHRPAAKTPAAEGPEQTQETVAAPDLSIPRDIFLPPTPLMDQLKKRWDAEQAKRKQGEMSNTPTGPSPGQAEIANLDLQGVFWSPVGSQAIINRKIVSVGDTINDAEVGEINKDGVILLYNGQEVELKMKAFRSESEKGGGTDGGRSSRKSWSPSVNMR